MTIAPVVVSVRVAAPPDRAFSLFARDMGRWWPHGMTIGARGNITGDLRLWHLDEPMSSDPSSDLITMPNALAAKRQSRASLGR